MNTLRSVHVPHLLWQILAMQRAIPDLLLLLKDKEPEVRIAACTALGKFSDPSTFDEITNVLLDDVMIEVRQSAARALGDTKHPAAIPFLDGSLA